jgi:Ala-tRNA(Pro) deacylase
MSLSLEAVRAFTGNAAASDLTSAVGEPSEFLALVESGVGKECAALLEKDASMLRALLNMGVRRSATQEEVVSKIRADATVQATMHKLAAHLIAHTFLKGERVSAVDVAVAVGLLNLFALVFPGSAVPAEFASVARWFATTTAHPAVQSFLAARRLLTGGQVRDTSTLGRCYCIRGQDTRHITRHAFPLPVPSPLARFPTAQVRVGGQVDLRPDARRVAALADSSIARNADHKKAASQRDAEKASREGAAAAPAAAGAGKEAAAPAAAISGHAAAGAGGVAASASQPEANKTLPELPSEERIALTHGRLGELGIPHTTVRHAAAKTVEDMLAAIGSLPGTKCKNLFIKAKKEKAPGDSRMWLVVAAHDSDTNLTKLAVKLGYGKIVLRFGDAESLREHLGVVQGHVSPFCLANDTALQVNVALDARLLASGAGPLHFHPQTNEASTAIEAADLQKFIAATGHSVTVVDFSA